MIRSIMLLLCQTLQIACKMYISTEGTSKVDVCSINGLEVLKSNNLKPLAQPSERESCELLMAAFVNIKIEKTIVT